MTPRSILVTGGAGFVGSHLCQRLIELGHRVIALDNFYTGRPSNVVHLLSSPRFELIRQDVSQPLDFAVDEIYNLACPASPIHYQRDPVQTTRTSVLGAMHVLELAQRRGAKVLQASTSEVYGDPTVHPQPEGYRGNVSTTGPRACYDEGKRCAETLFLDYHRQYGVRIKIARIFNTYGSRMQMDDGRVVSNFVCQALRGEDITLYGDGEQSRSFCHVDDLVEGLIRLMETPDSITGPMNLGNPHEISVRQLADTVMRLCSSSSSLVYRPLPRDDPRQRCPDISLAMRTLGWWPRVKLEDGLGQTIDYFRELLAARDSQGGPPPVEIPALIRRANTAVAAELKPTLQSPRQSSATPLDLASIR